ncbi:DNA-binding response regulator [Sulfobacillus harzensis]|uniref:Stage 0 sporulation protein A homolog n=1 Tax=Sulfobacillus harzensis TaxID=2729629 RepID=A0A7Y0L0L0_9FIRM|nr:DNA-binding response regulator [Sulfobacillus harzensis]NMP21025.1 DNA-binding response regulator [Sulfobacillus harzensis]
MQVWIIDDDAALRTLLSTALSGWGAHVSGFGSVEEALRAIEGGAPQPDVCFADWTLKDGPVLRVKPLMPDTRFVVMSGNPAAEEGLPKDIQWLAKPFRLSELNRMVMAER